MPLHTPSTAISIDDTDHYVYGWLNQAFYKMTDDDLFLLDLFLLDKSRRSHAKNEQEKSRSI